MRLAVLSDIHANREALEAALRLAEAARVEAVYCLGDVVGYGADPGPCVDLVQAHCDGCVRGNHDEAVALNRGLAYLPRDGQEAARLHRRLLTDAQRAYLAALPLVLEAHGATFVHASPERPGEWLRLDAFALIQAQFRHFGTPVCFIGHTHVPAVIANRLGVLTVRPGNRYLINVGSVGQPRDGDPRLAFGLYDTETMAYELVREAYDLDAAAAQIRTAGLPARLADRLAVGE